MDIYKEWKDQEWYNGSVKASNPLTPEEWAKQYLLGLTSEIGEVLRELSWKVHRLPNTEQERVALALELADLTKYTWCLWQQFGWSADDMLHWVGEKTEIMDFRRKQEMSPAIVDSNVLVMDLDGTVADWRRGFLDYLVGKELIPFSYTDPMRTLSLDIDMGWSYSTYASYKNAFERDGGYASLPPFMDNIYMVSQWRAQSRDHKLVIVTARPTSRPRVWYDTYVWLRQYGMIPDQLHFTQDGRIRIVLELAKDNREVVLLDDNPDIHLRSVHNDLRVLVPTRGYNWSIVPDPPKITKAVSLFKLWQADPSILPGGKNEG